MKEPEVGLEPTPPTSGANVWLALSQPFGLTLRLQAGALL